MTAAEKRLLDQMLMDGCSRAELFVVINAMLEVRSVKETDREETETRIYKVPGLRA